MLRGERIESRRRCARARGVGIPATPVACAVVFRCESARRARGPPVAARRDQGTQVVGGMRTQGMKLPLSFYIFFSVSPCFSFPRPVLLTLTSFYINLFTQARREMLDLIRSRIARPTHGLDAVRLTQARRKVMTSSICGRILWVHFKIQNKCN